MSIDTKFELEQHRQAFGWIKAAEKEILEAIGTFETSSLWPVAYLFTAAAALCLPPRNSPENRLL